MIRLGTRKNNRDTSHEPKTNSRRFLARLIAVSVLFLFLSILGLGQTSTSITGEIVDENGGKISGAEVRLSSRSGVQFSTATAGNGSFEFRDLPSGQYLIEVQAEGFAKFVTEEIVVERGQAKQLQLKLKVAGISENIVVTATGTAQRADEVSKVVSILDSQQIDDKRELSVWESLRGIPGVRVQQQGSPGVSANTIPPFCLTAYEFGMLPILAARLHL